jgi:hypothetical protein
MRRLWIVMTEMYGHRWTSSMGEEPNATWTEACREFTEEHWRNAISMLKCSPDDWPPSLPTFRRWALGLKSPTEAREAAARKADEHVRGLVGKYNPNCAGPTIQQAERMQSRLERAFYVDELDRERNAALGIEHEERDPMRICADIDYR